jgi:4-amino-4-deoxy-L-arabinose transferase-like glycosyltransferase
MLVQCVIGSFSVLLIYFLAKTVFNRQAAALAASWAAVYPLFLYYCGFLLAETIVIFLFLFFVLSVLVFLRKKKLSIMAGSGILYALLIHADPRFLFHFPFVFFYLYIGLADLRKTVKPFIMFSLIVLLFSVPWAVRNHFAYEDRFVLINTRTLDMWAKRTVVNVSGRTRDEQNSAGNAKPKSLEQFEEWKRKTLTEHPGYGQETPGDYESKRGPAGKISQEEMSAFENGARPSFSIPGLYLHHFLEFWRFARFAPGYDPYPDLRFERKWGRGRNLIGIAFTGVLLPFFAAGIFFCVKQKNRFGLLLCAIVFTHMLLHVIVHSRERYRMPIEGFIFMVAFYGLWEIAAKFKMYTKSGDRYEASQG